MRKRSDLAVVLSEFVDTTKSILDIAFTYVEDFDFKANARQFFAREIELIQRLDTKVQYSPHHEPFMKDQMKLKVDKCLGKQIKPIKFSPYSWVDTQEALAQAISEIKTQLSECNLLSLDLEYHTFGRVRLTSCNFGSTLAYKHHQLDPDLNLQQRLCDRCD